jgi:hypothetical protein
MQVQLRQWRKPTPNFLVKTNYGIAIASRWNEKKRTQSLAFFLSFVFEFRLKDIAIRRYLYFGLASDSPYFSTAIYVSDPTIP